MPAPDFIKHTKKKRIRTPIPKYKKVYTVYQYDRRKYSRIFRKIYDLAIKYDLEIFNRTSAYRVLDLCYYKDKQGNRKHLGDSKHIYRYRILQEILKEIADYILIAYEIEPETLKYLYHKTHLFVAYNEEYSQAELIETCFLPIKDRIKIHIALLRKLYKGAEIEKSITEVREIYKIPYKNKLILPGVFYF